MSIEALKEVEPTVVAAKHALFPPDFPTRIEHIDNDFDFREVVEDLQHSVRALPHYESASALTSCALLLAQASAKHDLQQENIQRWHDKISVKKLNGLVDKLLHNVHQPMAHLCLNGITLQHCHIQAIHLPFVSLRWADLSQGELSHADLHGGDLRHMNATGCNMAHIDLHESWLDDCHLSWSDLTHANLSLIQATDVDLSGAFLNNCNLEQAILSGANLSSTTLDKANLKGANLFGACLNMARLHGTNLQKTGITPARLAIAGMAVHADLDTIWGSEQDCSGRNPLA